MAITTDGAVMFTGSEDGRMKRWVLRDLSEGITFKERHKAAVHGLCISGGLLLSCSEDADIKVVRLHSRTTLADLLVNHDTVPRYWQMI